VQHTLFFVAEKNYFGVHVNQKQPFYNNCNLNYKEIKFMGLDTSFIILIDEKRYFIDFLDEKQKAEYRSFKEYERSFKDALPQNEQQISMNYWYPDDLPYSHPKRH